jgi:glycosyltransferase involved in cell wall biosynthesis
VTNRNGTRVLYVAGAEFFSGAERALLLTVQAVADAGHHPLVVVGTDGELLAQLRAAGLPAAHVPLHYTGLKTLPAWLAMITRLVGVIRRHRAQIVHTNEIPTFQGPGYAAKLAGVPAVTHARFPAAAEGLAWWLKPGFRRALFVSDYLKRDAESVAPALFANRAEVVYDGVQLAGLPAPDERAARRLELGLPADRPAVVIAGQVIEIKGIWEFIEAAARLKSRGVRATFVVLGDDLKHQGETRRQAEAKVGALGLGEDFRFLGFRSDAPALIPLFDIVAVPSHIEPLGNATLEAMAAARPVVGSRVGGIPEMIVDGQTGLLVPSKNAAELATALAALIGDPARVARLGAAGRARAETVFSLSAHAAHLGRVYDAVRGVTNRDAASRR